MFTCFENILYLSSMAYSLNLTALLHILSVLEESWKIHESDQKILYSVEYV